MDLRLRPVAPGDITALEQIGPDREAYLGFGGDPASNPTGGYDWAHGIIARIERAYWGRVVTVDGALAGEVKLHSFSEPDASARVAIGIFRPELRDRGIGRKVIAAALSEAFGSLRLHRVELRVLAKNTRAIRCYEAAGFRHEGRLREAAKIGGGFEDDLIMAILTTDPRPKVP